MQELMGKRVKIVKQLLDSDEAYVLAEVGDKGTIVGYYEGYPTVRIDRSGVVLSADFNEIEITKK